MRIHITTSVHEKAKLYTKNYTKALLKQEIERIHNTKRSFLCASNNMESALFEVIPENIVGEVTDLHMSEDGEVYGTLTLSKKSAIPAITDSDYDFVPKGMCTLDENGVAYKYTLVSISVIPKEKQSSSETDD